MRALALTVIDSGPQLVDIDAPTPGEGQIRIQVAASSINGFDVAVANGMLANMMEHRFPVVLGKDFAGTVDEVGPGVTDFAVGDRVFGVVMTAYLGEGGLGEYLVVNAGFAVTHVPHGLDITTAGALGLAGAAAVDAVDALQLQPSHSVLVVGATGGVGSLAIQYAAKSGARVIATAKPGAEAEFVRELGATDVVDPTGDVAAQTLALAPGGVNAIVHLAGDPSSLPALLAADGHLASTLGFGRDAHASAIAIMATPSAATLDRLASDVTTGSLRVPITQQVALADTAAAFAAFPAGTLGKIGVTVAL